jgi:hypothetical protein
MSIDGGGSGGTIMIVLAETHSGHPRGLFRCPSIRIHFSGRLLDNCLQNLLEPAPETTPNMLSTRHMSKLALRRAPLSLRHRPAAVVRAAPSLLNRLSTTPVRTYAQKSPGGLPGGAGGFPGLNMFGQQQEKGDALKQYVSTLTLTILRGEGPK